MADSSREEVLFDELGMHFRELREGIDAGKDQTKKNEDKIALLDDKIEKVDVILEGVVGNQSESEKNQKEIKKNQDDIKANQSTILADQKRIKEVYGELRDTMWKIFGFLLASIMLLLTVLGYVLEK